MSRFEMDAYTDIDNAGAADYVDTTWQDLREAIETNLWLAEGYHKRRAYALRDECLRAAIREYDRYEGILTAACGPALGKRIVEVAAAFK